MYAQFLSIYGQKDQNFKRKQKYVVLFFQPCKVESLLNNPILSFVK